VARKPVNAPPRPATSSAVPQSAFEKPNKGSASQPITIDGGTQPSSPRQAISAASQGTDFETQVRNAVPEAAIVAPLEGSEAATIATTEAAISEDDDEDEDEEMDAHLQDNFEGIDWSRLTKYCKLPRTQKQKKSWVYKHGYRVVLRNNMEKIFFICRACHLANTLILPAKEQLIRRSRRAQLLSISARNTALR
jgi:hypothetical protein